MNATSDCPYGQCDGTGIIHLVEKKTGILYDAFCQCHKDAMQKNRLKFADIPTEFTGLTVNSFEVNCYENESNTQLARKAKQMTANYIRSFEEFERDGKGIYFYSKTRGSGKTRLAVSLGNVLLNTIGRQVKFITSIDLLQEIKNTYNKDTEYTESQVIESVTDVDVLIIDDIGVENKTPWVNEILFGIFDNRMKHSKITIFTSNCEIENLEHDERLKSRIFKMCIPIKMPEEDVRKAIARKENEELQIRLMEGK
ncbi:ATP-binding protein [Anaerotignum sp.]|uniref:ATP-binding protein n=1 Tax=Anaerotignum sp. TaxID=2039241 RepID=UPI002714A3E3|nr:DnaA/Hda family protein [Anaerotignum sp.]